MRRRTQLVGFAAAALLVLAVPVARSGTEATPYPGGTWAPPEATYGQSAEINRSVRASDGAILKLDVLYPADPVTGARLPGPFPVVLNQDPYTGGGLGATSMVSGPPVNYFVQRGYIYVHLHQRGTAGPGPNGSEGDTDLAFGPRHGLDGVEVAYWAANKSNVPGSNGTVGLQGCSALGVIQLSTLAALGDLLEVAGRTVLVPGPTSDAPGVRVPVTANTNPIKAAIPSCFATSEYREQFTDNGVPTLQFAVAFAAPVAGVALFGANTDNPLAGTTPTRWSVDNQTGGDYGFDREFWQVRDWLRNADDIGRTRVPVLMQVGYQESGFIGAQPLFAALQNYAAGRPVTAPMLPGQKTSPRYQAVIGDWGHGGGIDPGFELMWFETWVKGKKTGLESASGALHLEELQSAGAQRWISPRTYPMTNSYEALYLGGGTLSGGQSPTAAEALPWALGAGQELTYTAAPFTEDTTLYGPAVAELWVESSTQNVQLYVELQDVAADGTATEITHGSIFGSRSHLETDAQRPATDRTWTAPNGRQMRPWLTLDADRAVPANSPVKLDVPLQPKTWQLPAGHSLRMVIGANPGTRCVPTTNPAAAPVPYGCTVPSVLLPSLTGGVFQILHDFGSGHASLLSAALVPSAEIPTTPSSPIKPGSPSFPQGW